jgi:hypothetical protein
LSKSIRAFTTNIPALSLLALDDPDRCSVDAICGDVTASSIVYLRRGRFTSSPPQFGQTFFISDAHFSQKVHSYEQIIAMPFAGNP